MIRTQVLARQPTILKSLPPPPPGTPRNPAIYRGLGLCHAYSIMNKDAALVIAKGSAAAFTGDSSAITIRLAGHSLEEIRKAYMRKSRRPAGKNWNKRWEDYQYSSKTHRLDVLLELQSKPPQIRCQPRVVSIPSSQTSEKNHSREKEEVNAPI